MQAALQLQLEVLMNGYRIDLVAGFSRLASGGLAATRAELGELGIKVPGEGDAEEMVALASLPGVAYRYDEVEQSIDFRIDDASRTAQVINVVPVREVLEAEGGTGLVVNYGGYAAANYDLGEGLGVFSGASLALDARAYSEFGVLRQTGVVGSTTFSDFTAVRLDTTWSYANPSRMEEYSLGDVISGSLRWTRPVRLGGAQVQRNFGLRPDIITAPLPDFQGSAAVPSTLDVYVNGVKTYSDEIAPGPFHIDRIPVISGNGTARVVLTDTTGRQTEAEKPVQFSPELLATGLFDYSLDIGVARRSYGTDSFDYDSDPLAIASLRYGLTNALTTELHVEANKDVLMGGVGAVFLAGPLGTVSGAIAASHGGEGSGYFGFAAWQAHFGQFAVQASTARTIGDFADLAAVTEVPGMDGKVFNGVPKAIDQMSVSYAMPQWNAGIGLNLVHFEPQEGSESLILGLNFNKSFDNELSIFVTGFIDLEDGGTYGALAGFSMPLGKGISATANSGNSNGNWSAGARVSKPMEQQDGSYGWDVSHQEQANRTTIAAGRYRGRKATVAGQVVGNDDRVAGTASIDGAVVAGGSGIFFSNRIEDSFAVVDAGAEDVAVRYENRLIGKTGKDGKLLVTQLRAYESNKISIDPENLPLNASIAELDRKVVPRRMSGVAVDFGTAQATATALVVITDANGQFIQPGTEVFVTGQEEPAIMGYDGEVFVADLSATNTLTVRKRGAACSVSFDFEPSDAAQTVIGPLQCG